MEKLKRNLRTVGTGRGQGRILAAAAVALFLLGAVSAQAHHSGSVYDQENRVTLQGIVTEFVFASPHVQIHFKTKSKDGRAERWTALSAPPQRLYRSGWNVRSLKAGDEITVTGAPMKDGTHIMNIRRLVGPTGQVLNEGAD